MTFEEIFQWCADSGIEHKEFSDTEINNEYYRILAVVEDLIPCSPVLKIVNVEDVPECDDTESFDGLARYYNSTGQVEEIIINRNIHETARLIEVICHELAHVKYFEHDEQHSKLTAKFIELATRRFYNVYSSK